VVAASLVRAPLLLLVEALVFVFVVAHGCSLEWICRS
jgi:hypothetical protein